MGSVGMRSDRRGADRARRNGVDLGDRITKGTGWNVVSTLLAGMVAYGAVGWVIGHFTHISMLFPIGLLVGIVISTGWVVYQYGRPHEQGTPPKGDDR